MTISDRVKTLREHGYGLEQAKLIEMGETLQSRIAAAETIIDLKLILHDIVDTAYPKAHRPDPVDRFRYPSARGQ